MGQTRLESLPPGAVECIPKIPPTHSDVVQDTSKDRNGRLSLPSLELADVRPVYARPCSERLLGEAGGESEMPESVPNYGRIGERAHGKSK